MLVFFIEPRATLLGFMGVRTSTALAKPQTAAAEPVAPERSSHPVNDRASPGSQVSASALLCPVSGQVEWSGNIDR